MLNFISLDQLIDDLRERERAQRDQQDQQINSKKLVIIDVRELTAFQVRHITDSNHIPIGAKCFKRTSFSQNPHYVNSFVSKGALTNCDKVVVVACSSSQRHACFDIFCRNLMIVVADNSDGDGNNSGNDTVDAAAVSDRVLLFETSQLDKLPASMLQTKIVHNESLDEEEVPSHTHPITAKILPSLLSCPLSAAKSCAGSNNRLSGNSCSASTTTTAADIVQVNNWLYLGSAGSLNAKTTNDELKRLGIEAMINCAAECPNPNGLDLPCLRLDLTDNGSDCLTDDVLATVLNYISNYKRVLIFCYAGLSRSVSVIMSVIMYQCQLSYRKALEQIRTVRPRADPNLSFINFLLQWQTKHGLATPVTTPKTTPLSTPTITTRTTPLSTPTITTKTTPLSTPLLTTVFPKVTLPRLNFSKVQPSTFPKPTSPTSAPLTYTPPILPSTIAAVICRSNSTT